MSTEIVIAGVGMVPFRMPGQSESYDVMGEQAARAALKDAKTAGRNRVVAAKS